MNKAAKAFSGVIFMVVSGWFSARSTVRLQDRWGTNEALLRSREPPRKGKVG